MVWWQLAVGSLQPAPGNLPDVKTGGRSAKRAQGQSAKCDERKRTRLAYGLRRRTIEFVQLLSLFGSSSLGGDGVYSRKEKKQRLVVVIVVAVNVEVPGRGRSRLLKKKRAELDARRNAGQNEGRWWTRTKRGGTEVDNKKDTSRKKKQRRAGRIQVGGGKVRGRKNSLIGSGKKKIEKRDCVRK